MIPEDDFMDHLSKEKRSWNMQRIRSRDTFPELIVRSFLHSNGFRFRLCVKTLPGKPDIVLPKYNTVIQVRGCFWHRHYGCKRASIPRSNLDYWNNKFLNNTSRDKSNDALLKKMGWSVIVIWECEVKNGAFYKKLEKKLEIISKPQNMKV